MRPTVAILKFHSGSSSHESLVCPPPPPLRCVSSSSSVTLDFTRRVASFIISSLAPSPAFGRRGGGFSGLCIDDSVKNEAVSIVTRRATRGRRAARSPYRDALASIGAVARKRNNNPTRLMNIDHRSQNCMSAILCSIFNARGTPERHLLCMSPVV